MFILNSLSNTCQVLDIWQKCKNLFDEIRTAMSICYTCNKPIEGKILSALDRYYHPEHFVCQKCKEPITENQFQTHDGNPYCAKDFAELFAPRCHGCNRPITDRIVKALGYDWHEEHFVCASCKIKLSGETFMEKDGKPMCLTCYQDKVADKCKACGKGIIDKIIIALDAKWHPECFKCVKCDKPITDEMFQVDEKGFPVCSVCAV